MTQEIIKRFAQEHGISTIRAMTVLAELLGKKEKSSTAMEPSKDMISNFSLNDIGW